MAEGNVLYQWMPLLLWNPSWPAQHWRKQDQGRLLVILVQQTLLVLLLLGSSFSQGCAIDQGTIQWHLTLHCRWTSFLGILSEENEYHLQTFHQTDSSPLHNKCLVWQTLQDLPQRQAKDQWSLAILPAWTCHFLAQQCYLVICCQQINLTLCENGVQATMILGYNSKVIATKSSTYRLNPGFLRVTGHNLGGQFNSYHLKALGWCEIDHRGSCNTRRSQGLTFCSLSHIGNKRTQNWHILL